MIARKWARLLLPLLAPALAPLCWSCGSDSPADGGVERAVHVVILSNYTGESDRITDLKERLTTGGARVIQSGAEREAPADLVARLPWLLQPGVDMIYYDERLAGPGACDSVKEALRELQHPAPVICLPAGG